MRILHYRIVVTDSQIVFDWLDAHNAQRNLVRSVAFKIRDHCFMKISIEQSSMSKEFEARWSQNFYDPTKQNL